jgi:hypothetical protein
MDIHALIGKLPRPEKGFTLPNYKYAGPYNQLDKQLDKNDKPLPGQEPYNTVDAISMRHDICYRDHKTLKGKRYCDERMLDELNQMKPKGKRERIDRQVVKSIIGAKKRMGLGLENAIKVGKLNIPANVPLTNYDILKYVKDLKIPCFKGVFMRNELKKCKPLNKECGIMNFNTSNESGSHWVCWVKKDKKRIYFDSFGQNMPIELERYLKSNSELKNKKLCIKRNHIVVQHINTVECGTLCLYVLYSLMNQHLDFNKVLYLLKNRYNAY